MANPDNISFVPGYQTLIIGEDTGSGHQNDMIWSYDLKRKALTRIQTTPYGSETTSPYIYTNINGLGYLTTGPNTLMAKVMKINLKMRMKHLVIQVTLDLSQL